MFMIVSAVLFCLWIFTLLYAFNKRDAAEVAQYDLAWRERSNRLWTAYKEAAYKEASLKCADVWRWLMYAQKKRKRFQREVWKLRSRISAMRAENMEHVRERLKLINESNSDAHAILLANRELSQQENQLKSFRLQEEIGREVIKRKNAEIDTLTVTKNLQTQEIAELSANLRAYSTRLHLEKTRAEVATEEAQFQARQYQRQVLHGPIHNLTANEKRRTTMATRRRINFALSKRLEKENAAKS